MSSGGAGILVVLPLLAVVAGAIVVVAAVGVVFAAASAAVSWAAEAIEEAKRRREAVARDQYRRAVAAASGLEEAVRVAGDLYGDLGVVPPAPTPVGGDGGTVAHEQAASATLAAVAGARARYRVALSEARGRAMAIPTRDVGPVALDDDLSTPVVGPGAPGPSWSDQADERRRRVAEAAARLPAEVRPGLLSSAEAAVAAALATTDDPSFERAMELLGSVVQTAGDEDARRRENAMSIEELRSRLDGLGGPEVVEARSALDRLDPAGRLPEDIFGRVAAAVATARAEQDRAYALDAIAASLEELDYEVGPGFTSAVARGGALVPIPEARRRAVRVTQEDEAVRFAVVPQPGPEATADVEADPLAEERATAEAEHAWCDRQEALLDALRHRGVELRYHDLVPPRPIPRPPVEVSTATEKTTSEHRDRYDGAAAGERDQQRPTPGVRH